MEIENKETPKSWKIKAKEKSIMIKALEKDLNLEFSKRTLIRFLKKLREPIKESENA